MKLVVFSDSHGNIRDMIDIVKQRKSDIYAVIHLGDCMKDADALSREFPLMPVCTVSGNCDGFFLSEMCDTEKTVEFAGVKIFVCHGHSCGVKASRDTLAYKAKNKGAKLALYGHTHVAKCENIGGITVLNPGSISCPRSAEPPSYAIIEVENGNIVSAEIEYCK